MKRRPLPPEAVRALESQAPRTWQRMLSGRRLNLIDPSPLDVEIHDIALGLARNSRWNGQTTGPHAWSVAQHSVLVVDALGRLSPASPCWVLLAALLHDAPEYVTHDLITPLKAAVGDVFREIETRLQAAVNLAFGLPAVLPEAARAAIKRADLAAAATEAVQLAGFGEDEVSSVLGIGEKPLPGVVLEPLPSAAAEALFLERFERLYRTHSAGAAKAVFTAATDTFRF